MHANARLERPFLLNTVSCVPRFSLFLPFGRACSCVVWVGSTAVRALCFMSQLPNWCACQERGKDDVTGEALVRRDDDQPEVSGLLSLYLGIDAASFTEGVQVDGGYMTRTFLSPTAVRGWATIAYSFLVVVSPTVLIAKDTPCSGVQIHTRYYSSLHAVNGRCTIQFL